MILSRVALLTLISTFPLFSQSSGRTTYCNPVDINYQYEFEQKQRNISYRSGADLVIVNHRGEYYLFVTNSGGWWHSTDLLHWNYVKPNIWPAGDMCAPAALSVRDTLYLLQSTFDRRPIYFTTTPWNGQLKLFNPLLPLLPDSIGPWDPDIYHDEETDRWFMYFGSSNVYPIYGIELDHDRQLTYVGKAKGLLSLHPDEHGWERLGQDHRDTIRPFIEGAWMTKHSGRYYLQYAAPGTEYNVYANGTYVGESPLGPFRYAPNNPVSYKPGGFMTGAGHGNTFQDTFGNYWNTGTPWVAVNFNFERRIAMFPAGFDRDGYLYSNTRFGDFPHYIPARKWSDRNELFTGWMLLSYHKPCTSSSEQDAFRSANVTDENPRTFWLAKANLPGAWITIDLQKEYDLKAVQVNYADYQSNIFASDSSVYTQFRMFASTDGREWELIADLTHERRDRPNAYIELAIPMLARYVKYEHVYTASRNLAISDIRIFGNGSGMPPRTPTALRVRRDTDRRNAFISWQKVPGAVGYNILWGIGRDKLYETYQRFADQGESLEIRALTVGQDYYFAVEAFDENGVSQVSEAVYCK